MDEERLKQRALATIQGELRIVEAKKEALEKKQMTEEANQALAIEQLKSEVRIEEYKRKHMLSGAITIGIGLNVLLYLTHVWSLAAGAFAFVIFTRIAMSSFRKAASSRDDYDEKVPAVSVRKYK